jgi:hypothetical protein
VSYLNKTIFVMVPAYRDPVLRETLDSIFQNALNPERVFVAIGAQYDNEIPMPDLTGLPSKNLRLLTIHPENRPGVYRLRSILNKLYAGEDYYLSIDSHTFLAEGWDEELIRSLESFNDKKTVLQAYEPGSILHKNGTMKYIHYQMSVSLDNEVNIPRLVMKDLIYKDLLETEEMPVSDYVQAGMIFTRGTFADEIRWGELWQNDQEEPFLSFEMFMLGWTSRLMVTQKVINHEPDRYYETVYSSEPESHNRNFRDSWGIQKDDLSVVCPKIFAAMISNSGPFKVLKAIKSPRDWWHSIGLEDEYEKYKDLF